MESEPQPPVTNIFKVYETREEALSAIKNFWRATHPDEFHDLDDEECAGELTAGDRTVMREG